MNLADADRALLIALRTRGLLAAASGHNVIRLLPPLTATLARPVHVLDLVRALATCPRLLLLDELAAGLSTVRKQRAA